MKEEKIEYQSAQACAATQFPEDGVIHCMGDSHTSLFYGLNKVMPTLPRIKKGYLQQFSAYNLGPVLAYNLIEDESTTSSKENLLKLLKEVIPPKSWVLLCFGEIDCRAHLIKHAEKSGQAWELVAQKCAERYLRAAKLVCDEGHHLIIYNSIPSARKDEPNAQYPTYGDCMERNRMTKLFNGCLKSYCRSQKIPFVDTFDSLVDCQGLTRSDYYMDPIHLSQKALGLTMKALSEVVPGFKFKKLGWIGAKTSIWRKLVALFDEAKSRYSTFS
ncbi:MAG: hypothetical protein ACPF9Q_03635 [Opitutales bacterium]